MNPLWALSGIGVLVGVLSMRVFRRVAARRAISETVNRMQAYLLEFWLFVDDPSLIWKSWRGLLAANGRLLRLLAVPVLVLSPPMVPLYYCLDSYFGHVPLAVRQPALVTAQLNKNLDPRSAPLVLRAPQGIAVETLPIRVLNERQVSWRIRPERPISGNLEFAFDGGSLQKSVSAGPEFQLMSQRRVGRLLDLLRYPTEMPLEAGPVDWIEVAYPPATLPFIGLDVHWSLWFAAALFVGAILPHVARTVHIR